MTGPQKSIFTLSESESSMLSLSRGVRWLTAIAMTAAIPSACPISSAQAADGPATVVASELDNPSGIAIHPESGHLFIATHPGVFRFIPGKPGKLVPEVTGFKTDVYGKGPKYDIGPLGVALLGNDHLVVGDGSLPDGSELVRVYKISANQAPDKPTAAEASAFNLGPITAGNESAKGEGNFYALAVNAHAIYVTANGDDTKGWVLKADVKEGKATGLKPFIATKPAVNVDAPVAITFSPDGKQLVIGQMGEINVPGDSLLTMYDPETGKLLKSLKTGLSDIAGLAYSPKTGKLYAVDYAWADTKQGGLFVLEVTGEECKATKIASLDKPTSLAFDKAGLLYITVFGTRPEGGKPSGQLVTLPAGL